MKRLIQLLGMLSLVTVLTGCASSREGSQRSRAGYSDSSNIMVSLLPDYIRTIPRLSVRGSGQNIQVYNSASSSFRNDTRVLFIVDDIQFGREYRRVANAFPNKNQTVSVEFLKISRATQRYGEAGRNGAIIIKTQGS